MSTPDALTALRAPFPPEQVDLLPKAVSRDDKNKGRCDRQHPTFSADGLYCGGYHSKSVHLSYVGHAALTARLLEVDPEWNWEPVATDETGLPAFDRNGGLWIKLTIAGMTRLGYGDAQGKTGPNAVKEAIGDALRNAGMRFGAALDLWSKSDLHTGAREAEDREWLVEAMGAETADDIRRIWREAKAAGADLVTLDKISVLGQERIEGGAA